MEIKNLFYQTGKILYKIAEVPFNVLVGNYNPKNQELIKRKRELKAQIKNLDSIKEENSLKIKNLDSLSDNLKYANPRLN